MTDRPPKLTFEKHVDYHAWYNDYVSRNKTENAYPYYLAVLEKIESGALPEPSEAVDKQIDDLKYGPVWKSDDFPELAAYLDSCREVLAEFEKATQIAHCWHPLAENERLLTHTLDNKTCDKQVRNLYRLTLVRSWKQADDQSDSFLRSWGILLRYADHMAQCQSLISDLTGLLVRTKVYTSVVVTISRGVGDINLISDAISLLESEDGNCAVGAGPLVVEWGGMLELLQWLCPNGNLDEARWHEFLAESDIEIDDAHSTFVPQDTVRLIDDCFRLIRNLVWRPYWFIPETDGSFFSRLGAYLSFKEYQSYNLEKKIDENAFTDLVVPSLTRPRQLRHRAETHRHGAMLTLGIHLFHARLGRWPESLDELGEHLDWDDFASIRRDLHTGDDIVYELVDGEPLLYTVGIDLDDDGGMHDDRWGESEGGGDYRFWPYPGD